MIPLVFLPGMMCNARLFGPQIDALSQGRTVIVASMNDHDGVHDMAAAILDQAPPLFALAGLSMGGIVAMEIMAQAPERVARLALMDTNPRAELNEIKALREPQITAAQSGHLLDVMRDEMKPKYLADGPQKAGILDLCMEMALDLGPEVFERQSRALQSRPDPLDTLRAVNVPTLVLCGREDALCPLERHELMHELIPHSTLEIIENAGHLPTLEQPQPTTAALRRWLETP